MYDIKPDRIGWTVFDIEVGRPFLLDDVPLIGLELEAADELASLLTRSVYRPGSKRCEVRQALFQPVVSGGSVHQRRA
jgi:hypothetical protein